MRQLAAAAFLLLAVLPSVTHASSPYVWENVGEPNRLTKHCLCRVLQTGIWIKDTVVRNVLQVSPCLSSCRYNWEKGEHVCAVYKREAGREWKLSNKQPSVSSKAGCNGYLRTERSLAQWAAARVANPPTQAQRKTIHLFWWGNPVLDKHRNPAMKGVNIIAPMLNQHGYTIKYYHQTTATVFTDGKSPSIPTSVQRVTIGNGGDFTTVGDFLQTTDLEGLRDDVNNVVGSYSFYGIKGSAALKDLAILCILYRYGGIFLDTAFELFDGTSHSDLDAALTDFTDDPFPKYPLLQSRDNNQMVDLLGGNMIPFFKVEFNGAWVPKNHPATKTAILQYILIAERRGLATGGQSSDQETHRLWTQTDRGHTVMVGKTIRAAVVKGLADFARTAPMDPSLLVFDTSRPKKSDGFYDMSRLRFHPMKLTKIYGGLWKEAAPTTKPTTNLIIESTTEKTTEKTNEKTKLLGDVDKLESEIIRLT